MRALTASELLSVWEIAVRQPLLDRQLLLIAKACSISLKEATELSIGERDLRLLLLREWHFGRELVNMATCPKCNERVEWEMTTQQLQLQELRKDVEQNYSFSFEGKLIHYRLPNSADIKQLMRSDSNESLLERCITNTEGFPNNQLTPQALRALDQQMALVEPQANISFELACPACQFEWVSYFDIMSYLWVEIDRWAKRIFQEIHVLARGYGWSEKEILSLSPIRRQTYLNMLQS